MRIILFLSLFTLFASDFKVTLYKSKLQLNPIYTIMTTDSQVQNALFEGLIVPDASLTKILPGLAKSWTYSKDQKTITFFLRENSRYSDGSKIKAQDFVDLWLYLIEENKKENFYTTNMLKYIKGVIEYRENKIDKKDIGLKAIDNKLIITLKEASPYFLKILSISNFALIHRDNFKDKDLIFKLEKIKSTGPYVFVRQEKDTLFFKKNKYYWDKDNVAIDNLTIEFNDNKEQNTKNFINGKVQWLSSDFLANKLNRSFIEIAPEFSTYYFYFNNKGVYSDKKIRLSILALIEKQKMNLEYTTDYYIPQIIPNYKSPKLEKLNKEEALKNLNDFKNDFNIVITYGYQEIANKIKENLKALNIQVNIIIVDFDDLLDPNNIKDDWHFIVSSWVGDYADPMSFLELWLKDNNDINYNDKEFNKLINKSNISLKNRYSLLSQAEGILLNSGLIYPLINSVTVNIIDLDLIDGWYNNVLDFHPFKYIKYKKLTIPLYVV